MFPTGLPGLALVLLRGSAAIALVVHGASHRDDLPGWAEVIAILISIALSVGYLTPIAAVASLAFHGLMWSLSDSHSAAAGAIVALDAIALALLGPGSYSIDSYLFGRRVVVIPPP